ncbi:sigma 54-interacting transcriptional regulator [Thermithiobacillus tepidarius DSM 3134]|uniref:sigma-54 interaction domain-containing protein n=1 Tax=Thermithiobacillus tepidarius TaxID=929 RepID=UPI00041E2011|nr:sigma-54-dependent Fis family transcriptional regulator [Thermithiobacillus tepidarius]
MSPHWSRVIQSIIDVQEDPFVLIDEQYRIVAANAAYSRAYGVAPAQVVGRHCHAVSHHLAHPCHMHGEDCPHQRVFQRGEAYQALHTHYDQHGEAEHVRIKGHPVQGPDGRLLLGESVQQLASAQELDCDEMRLIGRSPVFLATIEQLGKAAASSVSILLHGESGVGKELAARYVHQRSRRSQGPFLAVDCATLSESLFESEIFGHERGAFTGCTGRKQGLFELADGGTLFLDELGEIPLSVQAKLLRVLETGEFRRLGGRELLRADVRIVAATNRDLPRMVAEGRFREDLYYRLACLSARLPALRERRSDIPALAQMLLARINQANGSHARLSEAALQRLMGHDFPGNVRELRNVLQRAAAMCSNGLIGEPELGLPPAPALPATAVPGAGRALDALERDYLRELLARFGGNRKQAAEVMGISERTVYRKLKRYGLS